MEVKKPKRQLETSFHVHNFQIQKSQLPKEIQPHLTNTFRLISKHLTNQLPKRLCVPHIRLHKTPFQPYYLLIRKGKVAYPISFQILLLDVPDFREPRSKRRADLGDDVLRRQRAPDMLQRGRFQFHDLKSYTNPKFNTPTQKEDRESQEHPR